ncbi:hypothetical protein PS15p_208526 [Mucor circinelloides]
MSQDNCAKYYESDNDSCDTVRCFQESEDEFAAPTRAVLEEEEEARREREARGFSVPTGVLPDAKEEEQEGSDEEESDKERRLPADELFGDDEEEEEFYDSEEYQEEDEEDEYYEAEQFEDVSLIPNDISACSDMSIDMEVPRGFDGIAAVEVMQVDGSGCGWYSTINEDTEMEDAPFVDVEMLDADEGVDVVMEEVEEEYVEMEEVEDFMDVDEMFW